MIIEDKLYTIGPTAIKFLNSDKYGISYENELFVGDVHAGNMYHFKLNQDGTELVLEPPLDDKVADTDEESVSDSVLFATGLGGISDIEVSPYDGYMYVVSLGQGKIFRILPTGEGDTAAGSGTAVPPQSPIDDEAEDNRQEQDVPEQDEEEQDEEDEDEGNNDDNDGGDEEEDEQEDEEEQ